MGRGLNRLSAQEVAKLRTPGVHPDGGCLHLNVGPTGGKSWLFKFERAGRRREMGLGAYPAVSLAEARRLAAECREALARGTDPLEERRAREAPAARRVAVTFDQAAAEYIAAHESTWRNAKHRQQWCNSLATYASPVIGAMDVAAVEARHVLEIIRPIWTAKPETASRVRGRIETVLNSAKAAGHRTGENPATWNGNLSFALPARGKVRRVKHHASMAHAELPAFYAELCGRPAPAAAALRFAILAAGRTSEVLEAVWTEFTGDLWIIPAPRMKGEREHRVPVTPAMRAILDAQPRLTGNPHVFPGERPRRPLSNMSMLMLLRRMGRGDLTSHGFRSSFRDWAGEQMRWPRDVIESALAHAVEGKTEAAYLRTDYLAARRELMASWADYCDSMSHAVAGEGQNPGAATLLG